MFIEWFSWVSHNSSLFLVLQAFAILQIALDISVGRVSINRNDISRWNYLIEWRVAEGERKKIIKTINFITQFTSNPYNNKLPQLQTYPSLSTNPISIHHNDLMLNDTHEAVPVPVLIQHMVHLSVLYWTYQNLSNDDYYYPRYHHQMVDLLWYYYYYYYNQQSRFLAIQQHYLYVHDYSLIIGWYNMLQILVLLFCNPDSNIMNHIIITVTL